jgi:hypothetical protein
MRWFFCSSCARGYNVYGDHKEIARLLTDSGKGFQCITPMCRGRLIGTVPHSHSGVYFTEISLQDFYRATKGFGLSGAAPASLKKSTKLLLEKRIVAVEGEPIGTPERTIIRCLILEDGTRLHFDTSSKGACLYYIEEPRNELPSAATPEGDSESGEEAGRGPQALPESI